MKIFIKIYILLLLLTLNSCWILPKEVSRSIYFQVPARSQDLIPDKNSKFVGFVPDKEVLNTEEEQSPLEFSSRDYFSKGHQVALAKPNVLDTYKDGQTIVGYHDGSVYIVKKDLKGDFYKRLIAKGTSQILSLKISPDQKYLAVSQFSVVTIINLDDFTIVAQLHRVKGRILKLSWSPDSSVLLLGRANGDVFSWKLEDNIKYTLDSLDVLELYETEPSPVVDIIFHPSGRAFFVALENGGLFLVRLIQTEIDLGLREEGKEYEIDKGSYIKKFGMIPNGISKMAILPEREEIVILSIAGVVSRWRIRGLVQTEEIEIGSESSTFVALYEKELTGLGFDITASIGRSLRLKLSCLSKNYINLVKPTTDILKSEEINTPTNSNKRSSLSIDDEALIRELNSEIKRNEIEKKIDNKARGKDLNLIVESPKYLESISVMELDKNTGELWVGGKSGIMSSFNLKKYMELPAILSRTQSICN